MPRFMHGEGQIRSKEDARAELNRPREFGRGDHAEIRIPESVPRKIEVRVVDRVEESPRTSVRRCSVTLNVRHVK